MKFVPASGAASRMFKSLLSAYHRYEEIKADQGQIKLEEDPDFQALKKTIKDLRRFAFFDDLKSCMTKDDLDIEALLSQADYAPILEYLLTPKGIDIAGLPKGLIPFHQYLDHHRTPFEEHMVEANVYARDKDGVIRLHFTVPETYQDAIKEHIEAAQAHFNLSGGRYEITYSTQKPSTDTIAVDIDNQPFRDQEGRLLFRPGGHGALLENLNDLKGDITFIKNIDNIVPDRLKSTTYTYKRALGGYLTELQDQIFEYLKRLSRKDLDQAFLNEVFDFINQRLSIIPPDAVTQGSMGKQVEFLVDRLNRPLRICGIVKNEGEPGGGPFWVEHEDGTLSKQVIESAQVDMHTDVQKEIWQSSTHFSPVDLVCGVRDYSGNPFNLMEYRDPDTGFISIKSKDGRELKALELPGLWNGSMAFWNTVFVEVPVITFNPVKTILDLLRKEHQPE